jgi:hypothetical protein
VTVWKFVLQVAADYQAVNMPAGAQIVHVDAQGDDLCMWAIVDANAEREERRFTIVGTGHIVPRNGVHVGSALMRGGSFVWHVFEEAA